MGKVNLLVKYCLINEEVEYNIKGIFQNNQIKFFDNDNKMILDLKLDTLKRITKEAQILFDFKNKVCSITENSSQARFDLKLDLIDLKKDNHYFYVKYKIDENEFLINIRIISF